MARIFELEIPATPKLVLLAAADHARDDGTGCYPSIAKLAKKTSLSRRGTQKVMRRLQEAGFISDTGKISEFGTIEYTITLDGGGEQGSLLFPAKGANATPKRGEPECAKGANHSAQKGRTGFARIINKNHQEPSGNLAAAEPQLGSKSLPQQKRWSNIAALAVRAEELLTNAPKILHGDLVNLLKAWAAANGRPYFDAWPGTDSPIEQAIKIAMERRQGRKTA